jgi:hypothetical protein
VVAFAAAPALSAVVPLLALPAITSRFGADAWVSIAVAQSIGAAAAVVVELGWGLTGTLRVGRQSARNRRRTAALSLATRAIVLAPVAVIVAVVVPHIVGPFALEATIVALAAALGSVNLVWFFIGVGSPGRLLLSDVLPRTVVGTLAAVLIATAGWPVAAYAGAMLAGAVLASLLGAILAGVRPASFRGYSPRRLLRTIEVQASAVAGRVVSAGYIALPVTLVNLVAPAPVVAVFAAAERLQRMVLTGLQAVPNALQHGVGRETDPTRRRRRARAALVTNGLIGVLAGAVFTAVAPAASHVLFSGEASVPLDVAALGGLLIVVVSVSRITGGIMLVDARRIPTIFLSALAGALVGIPAILALSRVGGTLGAVTGELIAEGAVLLVQFSGLKRAARDRAARRLPEVPPRVAYLRVEDPGYPRNARIREALESAGADVTVFRRSLAGPKPLRILHDTLTLLRSSRGFDVFVVAEFSLAFAPLARVVARASGAVLVVDGFVGRYETAVEDWGLVSPRSARARWYRLIDTLAIAAADVYLVDTKVRADVLASRHRGSRIRSLPVGAPAWAVAVAPPEHDVVRLLYYGSYLPLHGLPTVVDALALLGDGVALTLVGEAVHAGGEADTRAAAERRGVLDRCTFLPPVPAPELARLIAEHDVVLGIFGGSSKASSVIANKVWQGLACGRTVVTRESPALDEIRHLVGPRQLLTVPAEDPVSLAAELTAWSRAGRSSDLPCRDDSIDTGDRLDHYVADEFSSFLAELAVWSGRPSLAGPGGAVS